MKAAKKAGLIILSFVFIMGLFQTLYASGDKININTATQEELTQLKFIGEKISLKIIEYRQEHPFQKAEDLINVKGIGEKVFNANKERIVVKD